MRLVDCTGLALRLFQQRRRWNRRMINEDAKISHTFRAQREAPGRTGKPNSSAPDTTYAVQPAIFRLAPVPHARSTLLMHFQDRAADRRHSTRSGRKRIETGCR